MEQGDNKSREKSRSPLLNNGIKTNITIQLEDFSLDLNDLSGGLRIELKVEV